MRDRQRYSEYEKDCRNEIQPAPFQTQICWRSTRRASSRLRITLSAHRSFTLTFSSVVLARRRRLFRPNRFQSMTNDKVAHERVQLELHSPHKPSMGCVNKNETTRVDASTVMVPGYGLRWLAVPITRSLTELAPQMGTDCCSHP